MKYLFAVLSLTAIVVALHDPNLDMPVGGGLFNNDSEDEDAPEIISYYGSLYQADALVLVLDHSGSIRLGNNLEKMRKQTQKVINEIQEAYLNIIIFHDEVIKWRNGVVSVIANKSSAINFAVTQKVGVNTFVSPAIIEALKQLRRSVKRNKRIILVADGTTSENPVESLEAIKKNNPAPRIPIDTIFLHYAGGGSIAEMLAIQGREYLTAVSSQSGGKFREVR